MTRKKRIFCIARTGPSPTPLNTPVSMVRHQTSHLPSLNQLPMMSDADKDDICFGVVGLALMRLNFDVKTLTEYTTGCSAARGVAVNARTIIILS